MTRKQRELRERANLELYMQNNLDACLDAIMGLYDRIPNTGGDFKPLFRYRKLNGDELESLDHETIFMRWPSSYEDKSDCKPVVDYKEIATYIGDHKYHISDDEKLTSGMDIKSIENNPEVLKRLDKIRNMWMISCFTEKKDNKCMWSEYADYHSGICLEYDFKKVLDKVKEAGGEMRIMPVRYIEDRDCCSDMALNHKDLLNMNDDAATEAKYKLACMTKEKLLYSFEEEWRLIYDREKKIEDEQEQEQKQKTGDSIPFINPKRIICGKAVDQNSAEYKKLIEIAEDKGIEMVQMDH